MLPGYNTNGMADHQLGDALAILADIGYQSVALTLERRHLDPPNKAGIGRCVAMLTPLIARHGLHITIETGSRFILDPQRKHQPTLISVSPDERRERIAFIQTAVDIAQAVGADAVSLWSGAPDDEAKETELNSRLVESLREILDHATAGNVPLAFEPEPGMFIDTMTRFEKLHADVDHPLFGLTLDVGHIHCLSDGEIGTHIHRWRHCLWNVHIEDMRRGVHEHLPFGQGDMDFTEVFEALRAIDYPGPLHVELPRHSRDAVETARHSYAFIRRQLSRHG